MGIIGFLVFGLVVGAVARLIKPGKQNLSILATLGLGVVGSLIGGVVATLLGTGSFTELNILGAIVAIVAAVLLIGVAESVTGRRVCAPLTHPRPDGPRMRAGIRGPSHVRARPTTAWLSDRFGPGRGAGRRRRSRPIPDTSWSIPMARNTLSRSLHDVGLAAWFGGTLANAVALNAAAAEADGDQATGDVANAGWDRWTPVNAVAIGAHLLGSIGQLRGNADRVAGQQGVARHVRGQDAADRRRPRRHRLQPGARPARLRGRRTRPRRAPSPARRRSPTPPPPSCSWTSCSG